MAVADATTRNTVTLKPEARVGNILNAFMTQLQLDYCSAFLTPEARPTKSKLDDNRDDSFNCRFWCTVKREKSVG